MFQIVLEVRIESANAFLKSRTHRRKRQKISGVSPPSFQRLVAITSLKD